MQDHPLPIKNRNKSHAGQFLQNWHGGCIILLHSILGPQQAWNEMFYDDMIIMI